MLTVGHCRVRHKVTPLTRQMSVLNRYVPQASSDTGKHNSPVPMLLNESCIGDVQYVEDTSRGGPGHIQQTADGKLETRGLLDMSVPTPPPEWDECEVPMQLTLAFGLGNESSHVVLPDEEMTVWQALQRVQDVVSGVGPSSTSRRMSSASDDSADEFRASIYGSSTHVSRATFSQHLPNDDVSVAGASKDGFTVQASVQREHRPANRFRWSSFRQYKPEEGSTLVS